MTAATNRLLATISFPMRAEKTIVNDTVKITVMINAMIQAEDGDASFRKEVAKMMDTFMPGVTWQYANLSRRKDVGTFEKATLSATARISETDAFNLDARAQAACNATMTLSVVENDTSMPQDEITKAESALRIEILTMVEKERSLIEAATSVAYKLHAITFNRMYSEDMSNRTGNRTLAASASYESVAGPKGAQGPKGAAGDSFGNAQKFILLADVVIAVPFA